MGNRAAQTALAAVVIALAGFGFIGTDPEEGIRAEPPAIQVVRQPEWLAP